MGDSYEGRDSYKEFTCIYDGIHIYGGIHIRSSHVSMEGFIQVGNIYLWRDSYIGRNSYKEFTCIYGGIHIEGTIHIRSSNVSRARFTSREGFRQVVHMYVLRIHQTTSHTSIEGHIYREDFI